MKHSYIIASAIALSLAAVSCSDETNELEGAPGRFNENEINLTPSTSRADITDLQDGFKVYATKGISPSEFAIEEEVYAYDATDKIWSWGGTGDAPTWPESTSDYPMYFYAFYGDTNGTNTIFTVDASEATNSVALTSEITIPTSDKQTDILAAIKKTDVLPTGGTLSMNFNHILSQVALDVVATENSRVHIQSINFCDLKGSNTYDFMDETNGWDNITSDPTSDYIYLKHSKDALELLSSSSTSTVDAAAKYAATYPTLYLMPHELESWDKSATIEDSRIEVIFRVTKDATDGTDGNDMLGYTDAEAEFGTTATAGLTNSNSPLFIKMAVPLSVPTTNTWEAGSSYVYQIKLGATGTNNGYFVDKNYYDEDGVRTDIPIENAEPGDEVTSGDICFSVTLSPWTSAGSVTLTE